MVIPFLLPAAAAAGGAVFGKSAGRKEGEEKLELAVKLAELTPDQAAAVDAVKKMDLEEARARVKHGVGPYGKLPATASARATQAREAARARKPQTAAEKAAAAAQIAREEGKPGLVSSADRAAIATAQDPKQAVRELVDRKVTEAKALLSSRDLA